MYHGKQSQREGHLKEEEVVPAFPTIPSHGPLSIQCLISSFACNILVRSLWHIKWTTNSMPSNYAGILPFCFRYFICLPAITEVSWRPHTWWQNNQIYTHFSYDLLFTEFCCAMFSKPDENMSLKPSSTSVPFLSLSTFATAAFIMVCCCFSMSRSSSNFLWCSFKSSIASLPSSKQVNPRFWMLHTDKSLWIATICSTHKIYHICIRII